MHNKLNTGASAAFRPHTMEQQEYNIRKLTHYNKWLATKSVNGKPYPGFPEDAALLKKIKDEQEATCIDSDGI